MSSRHNWPQKKYSSPAGKQIQSSQPRERYGPNELQKSFLLIDLLLLSSVMWLDLPLLFQHPFVQLPLFFFGYQWENQLGCRCRNRIDSLDSFTCWGRQLCSSCGGGLSIFLVLVSFVGLCKYINCMWQGC
jgi:hypothetical protein